MYPEGYTAKSYTLIEITYLVKIITKTNEITLGILPNITTMRSNIHFFNIKIIRDHIFPIKILKLLQNLKPCS